ncbi:DNA integrity scanning protein DisA nucleotide-binding domain protein [Priestia megaterium]|uniref:DNA integrity scanning protein DisA nucleotide-binding domain protein n=1 Tax=Priestia megaterium TaxID=1404 RepID=UPI00112A7A80|nr:DNA integrity scanning protein DisA nucleotide-binding domain protein [Priestia megaterium]TPF18438.1 hypothetical protein CBE78_04220 [Priestia megaterium]TPF22548.1 hypothetical protein CBE79_06730 [Priestia megaterium]
MLNQQRLPRGATRRSDGRCVLANWARYEDALEHIEELGEWFVTKPYEDYNELFNRLGTECEANIIVASVTVHGDSDKDIYYLSEINVYYKEALISKKYNMNPLSFKYGEKPKLDNYEVDNYQKMIIDFIDKENISHASDYEYIRYMYWDKWLKTSESERDSLKKWNIKITLVEYPKKCIEKVRPNGRVADLYYNVVRGVTDWHFDKYSNYIEELLVKEGRNTLNGVILDAYDLYDKIHNLSLLKYEREENKGQILFSDFWYNDYNHPNLKNAVIFKKPIDLSDSRNLRGIRKLLEISHGDVFLLCDLTNIFGIYKLQPEDKILEDIWYSIVFKGQGVWEFRENKDNVLTTVMKVTHGVPCLPKQKIDKDDFLKNCNHTFGELEYSYKLWDFINEAIEQKHGTMIVITDRAEEEAARLSKNAVSINAIQISDLKFVKALTSIDGAIILDPFGTCHSIGCILDGISNIAIGDSSRGARFNSALRYINYCKNKDDKKSIKVIVVVISEDGMIDILTEKDIPEEGITDKGIQPRDTVTEFK